MPISRKEMVIRFIKNKYSKFFFKMKKKKCMYEKSAMKTQKKCLMNDHASVNKYKV